MHGLGMLDKYGCRHASEYVIVVVIPQQQWVVERSLMLCYMLPAFAERCTAKFL